MYMYAPLSAKPFLDGFDMFASAESRSLEIHAGTIIPFAVGSTIHHLVLVVLFRVANDILSRAKGVINTTDIEVLDIGHLLAQFDLPFFQSHVFGFHDMRNLVFLLFPVGLLGAVAVLTSHLLIVLCHCCVALFKTFKYIWGKVTHYK